MKEEEQVTCIDADYDTASGIITWRLATADGEKTAMYHISDMAQAISLKGTPTEQDWKFFCKEMKGKTFKMRFENP